MKLEQLENVYKIGQADFKDRMYAGRSYSFRNDLEKNIYCTMEGNHFALKGIAQYYASFTTLTGESTRSNVEDRVMDCYKQAGMQPTDCFLWFGSLTQAIMAVSLMLYANKDGADLETDNLAEFFLIPQFRQLLVTEKRFGVWSQKHKCEFAAQVAYTQFIAKLDSQYAQYRYTLQQQVQTDLGCFVDSLPWQSNAKIVLSQLAGTPIHKRIASVFDKLFTDKSAEQCSALVASTNRLNPMLLGSAARGPNDAFVCAMYHCLLKAGFPVNDDRFYSLQQMTECGVWLWPMRDCCIVMERPRRLHLNKSNQLHNLDGPALVFSDRSELYAWQGSLIPDYVVNRQFSVSDIELQTMKNVQSAMLSIYGASRYLRDVNAEEVHRHEQVVLYRRSMEAGGEERLLALYETETGCCYFRWIPITHRASIEAAVNWALEQHHDWSNELLP